MVKPSSTTIREKNDFRAFAVDACGQAARGREAICLAVADGTAHLHTTIAADGNDFGAVLAESDECCADGHATFVPPDLSLFDGEVQESTIIFIECYVRSVPITPQKTNDLAMF